MTYISIDREQRASDPNSPPLVEQVLPPPDGRLWDVRMRILVAIEQLTEIQRQVIAGLFYKRMSQAETERNLVSRNGGHLT